MAEMVLGPVLGFALQGLWDVIKAEAGRSSNFKSKYERLDRALKCCEPVLGKLQMCGDPKVNLVIEDLCRKLQYGEGLIKKCAKQSRWNLLKTGIYSKQLDDLEEAITSFSQVTQMILLDEAIKLLSKMHEINAKLYELLGHFIACDSDSSAAALPPLPEMVFGMEKPLSELKMMLQKYQVVGVCGLGGSGKTTLVNKLCREAEIIGQFGGGIFFFPVSSSPDMIEILRRMWPKLVGGTMLAFQSVEDAVRELTHRLNKMNPAGNKLIVLDDVWSEKDLKNLVFKASFLKTIVTSREDLKTVDKNYSQPVLTEEAAKKLFYHAASIRDPTRLPTYARLADEIIRRCDGLPLALEHIGGILRWEPLERWQEIRACLLSNAGNGQNDILNCLSTTISFLKKELQECFCDMGSFPEDKMIRSDSIIDMWVELYDLKEEQAYLKLVDLSKKYLLNLTRRTRSHTIDGGNYQDVVVGQHDLLRELAILCWDRKEYTEKKRLVIKGNEAGDQQENQALHAELVSVQGGESSFPSCSLMQLPLAKVLLLNFSAETCHLPSFLESMVKLKALIITNRSLNQAKLSEFQMRQISSLRNLRRMRLERISISGLFDIQEPLLQNLHKLSIFFCEFGQSSSQTVPEIATISPGPREPEIHHSTELQRKLYNFFCKGVQCVSHPAPEIRTVFPELRELEIHYSTDLEHLPPAVCEMRKLKKLSVTKCPDLESLPERIDQLTNLEFLNFHACSSLEGLPDSICELKNLKVLDVSDCSNVDRLPDHFGKLSSLTSIDMSGCSDMKELPESANEMTGLQLVACDAGAKQLWDRVKDKFKLTKLDVYVPEEECHLRFLQP